MRKSDYFGDRPTELLFADNGRVYLRYDNIQNEDYWKSKLAFFRYQRESIACRWHIALDGDLFNIDNQRRILLFPVTTATDEMCYSLRVAIDCLQLLSGRLPLHAAAVAGSSCNLLLFGRSGSGKSYLADKLAETNRGISLVGDDHIYLLNRELQGNVKRRLRDERNKEIGYRDNTGFAPCNTTIGICVGKSAVNLPLKEIDPNDWVSHLNQADALKYAVAPFTLQYKHYLPGHVFDQEIISIYTTAIFRSGIQHLYSISGSLDYILNCIHLLL